MALEDLWVYNVAREIGENVWSLVDAWNYFQKDTIGKQLVKAADSIAANISEGYGRYHFKDSKNFLYYSRGSIYETKTWLSKARTRNLIIENDYISLCEKIELLTKMLNSYINSIGTVNEPETFYNHEFPLTNDY
jgi:four helix bundle protein